MAGILCGYGIITHISSHVHQRRVALEFRRHTAPQIRQAFDDGTRDPGTLRSPGASYITLAGWCGLAMVTAGLLVSSVAVMKMATAWRIGIDRDNPGSLVTGGSFRYVRHPIYVGMLSVTSGMAITTADLLSVAVAAASWLGIPLQARMEEEFLSSVHGAEYQRYRSNTGRSGPDAACRRRTVPTSRF